MIDNELDSFEEDEEQRENLNDFDLEIKNSKNRRSVLSSSDWTTETIISQINKGNIVLNPDFQRRDAWDKVRKSKFIESLFLGFPIPQLVLAESPGRRGSYLVLDGKQRLLSLRQFSAKAGDPDYEQLKLVGLEIRKDLKGYCLDDLRSNLMLYEDVTEFENQPIRTVVIRSWPNEQYLYDIFLRLNTGSVSLSTQELRQALHPGKFVRFLDRRSGESPALRTILKKKSPDFRMRDAELLLRYFAFKNFLSQYSGSLKVFLDDCCKKLNHQWEQSESEILEQAEEFEKAHLEVQRIFGTDSYKKWKGGAFETKFNRSIFDIMILAFSQREIRDSINPEDRPKIKELFQDLCSSDADFLSSLETTTKSITATYNRISKWNNKLNKILKVTLHVPVLRENRII